MSTPEAAVQLTEERSRQWQDSFHALFDGVVRLEEMERPRGLSTYLEGYSPDFDAYRASLSQRELSELNHYLGSTGPYRGNLGRFGLLSRDKHPVHSEITKPFRYLRREIEAGPIEDYVPDKELSDESHVRAIEHRFEGALHARFLTRTFTFSKEDPMYEVSVYKPRAGRQRLSLSFSLYPARNSLTLSRIALHQPAYLARYPKVHVEPIFTSLLDLLHEEKAADAINARKRPSL